MKRIIPVLVALVAALATILYLQLRERERLLEAPSGGSATIEGIEVSVVPRVPGRIVRLGADEGERVRAGQVLVELDCAEPNAALAQAKAAVAAAEAAVEAAAAGVRAAEEGVAVAVAQAQAATAQARAAGVQGRPITAQRSAAARALKRAERLGDAGGVSEQDLDRAGTQVATLDGQLRSVRAGARAARAQADAVGRGAGVAERRVEVARAQQAAAAKQVEVARAAQARAAVAVGECVLRAPRAARVNVRSFEEGEVVMPGARIMTLVDTREVRATFYLPNAELGAAKPGAPVEVVADAYPGERFQGSVRRVGEEAEFTPRNVQTREDRDRLVYAVEVTVPNPAGKLRPGMPCEVTLRGAGGAAESGPAPASGGGGGGR